jgi:hypothetical protein
MVNQNTSRLCAEDHAALSLLETILYNAEAGNDLMLGALRIPKDCNTEISLMIRRVAKCIENHDDLPLEQAAQLIVRYRGL